jgi:methylglutaconyl-CoA hydratase
MTATVRLTIDRGRATITLDRPERRNALSRELVSALQAALDATAGDEGVRVVVLTSAGPTFCAGADLAETPTGADAEGRPTLPQLLDGVLASMLDHPKPIVGRITGDAYGGGLGLIAACDLVVAAASVRMAFSEVRLGAVPAAIAPYVLRKVSPTTAARLMMLAEPFDAAMAAEAGLLTDVVEDGAVDAVVMRWCGQLARGGPQALAVTKRVLTRVPGMAPRDARTWASAVSAAAFASLEAEEGIAAFGERRAPSWAPPGTGG